MNAAQMLSREGHRLLQLGVALFLFTSFEGFAVQRFAAPSLGRAVHTLSGFTGLLVIALGLVWPRLRLSEAAARVAFWLLIYSALATIAGFLLAAVWGAGNTIMPIAAGAARGSDLQEAVIAAVMYPAAPTGIIAFALVLWGLRLGDGPSGGGRAG